MEKCINWWVQIFKRMIVHKILCIIHTYTLKRYKLEALYNWLNKEKNADPAKSGTTQRKPDSSNTVGFKKIYIPFAV